MTDLQAAGEPTAEPKAPNAYVSPHVVAVGAASMSITQALADTYHWFLTWPLHAPTEETCASLAVLTIAFVSAGGFAIFGRKKS